MYIIYKENTKYTVKYPMIKKFLWPLYAGFVIYSLITLFSGTVGMSNMKALNYFKINMINHVQNLEMKSTKLEDEIDRLISDTDRLKLAGRPLGYIEPGQNVIKILNSNLPKELYELDHQYELPKFKQNTNRILLVSCLFTVILVVMFILVGVVRDTFKRK